MSSCVAALLLFACAGNPGPWQWVESPKPGVPSETGVDIPALGLRLTVPQGLTVFESCKEDPHIVDEAGVVAVLSCSSSKSPNVALRLGATTSDRFPDDAAIGPMREEYEAAGWTIVALGYDGNYQGKPGIYARLQKEDREVIEFHTFSKGVLYIATLERIGVGDEQSETAAGEPSEIAEGEPSETAAGETTEGEPSETAEGEQAPPDQPVGDDEQPTPNEGTVTQDWEQDWEAILRNLDLDAQQP